MSAPASHNAQARTARDFRIAEFIKQFEAQQDEHGVWRVRDKIKSEWSVATYPDEPTAKAGARLRAATDIGDYFDGRIK